MILQEGEVREVGIEIINQTCKDFIIDAAEYKIINKDKEILEEGFATINTNKILLLFNATKKGEFSVIFKYHIGPEILKAKIYVEVI